MKNIITFCISLFTFLSIQAQVQNPVKWVASYKSISATEGEIVISATIDKGWHKAEKVNPDDPVLSGWQSWEVNDITGDKRINGLVQAITPVYPEAAAIPFPKLGNYFLG